MGPDDLSALLDRLLAGRENEVVEFKSARRQFDRDRIGEYVSALSNEANLRSADAGWLVFGVDDTRQVVGTSYLDTVERQNALKQHIQHGIDQSLTIRHIHEVLRPAGRVVLLQIPPAPRGIPISWHGDYRGRAGESLVSLSLDKLDEIRAQSSATDWTAVVVPEASVTDLDPAALARARAGFLEHHSPRISAAEVAAWDDATFLARAKLTRNGGITRAALLLLGSDDSRHLLSPHLAQLTWNLRGAEQAYEHFHLPFLLTATALSQRIRNLKLRLLPPNELIYREIAKYDERSILEAVYNGIAHQDYRANSRIIVTEYVDRLEFLSVGGFFDGTPDQYVLEGRMPRGYRNPFLVEAMSQLNLIDQMGYGIHRMAQDQARRFLPLPDFDLSEPGEVTLTLHGAVIDDAYSRLLVVRPDLPLEDVLALDRVQKRLAITAAALARLRSQKLVEGRRPHVHVSADIAAATDEKAAYIRTRAQDDAHYARLITEYLSQYGSASRGDIDTLLRKFLPDVLDLKQQRAKVTNLLSKMRREGVIQNVGTRPRPRWELVYPPSRSSG